MRKSLATQRDHGGAGDVAVVEYGRCSVGPELGVPRQCYEPSRRLDADVLQHGPRSLHPSDRESGQAGQPYVGRLCRCLGTFDERIRGSLS